MGFLFSSSVPILGCCWIWLFSLLLGLSVVFPLAVRAAEQEEAFRVEAFQQFGLKRRVTGVAYDIALTGTLLQAKVQAVRLRTGSLFRRGLSLNEFNLSAGCLVQSEAVRILLVYENVRNSSLSYPIQIGYRLVSPIIGLLAYDASNLTSSQTFPPLNVSTNRNNITVSIPISLTDNNALGSPQCVLLDNGVARNVILSSPNGVGDSVVCSSDRLGIFYLIGESPQPPPPPKSNRWKIILGTVLGIALLLAILGALALLLISYKRSKEHSKMELHSTQGETLQSMTVRNMRTPAAGSTRTKPALEKEYDVS